MTTQSTFASLAALIAAAWITMPAAQANTPTQGVKCPDGTSAQRSDGDRKLVCSFQERVERASVCSPLVFKNNGDINLNTRIEHVEAGSDTCRARNLAGVVIATEPSQALLLPGDNPAHFQREVRAGKDVFVRMRTSHRFPEGGPIYLGDASRGVQCEAGFEGTATFNGRGVRCDRREHRVASCDVGWTIDRRSGLDKCFMEKIVFGNKVRVDGQYTVPQGMTGLFGNPENNGWNLRRDHVGVSDYWAREAREYRFPVTQ